MFSIWSCWIFDFCRTLIKVIILSGLILLPKILTTPNPNSLELPKRITSSASSSVTSSVWTYSWEVPTDIDSQVSLAVSGTDLAGNLFGLSDPILFTVDNTAATASITSESGASVITNLTANILRVDLTEVSPDFSLSSMSVTPINSILGNLSTTDSKTFYVNLTPQDGYSGEVIVSVDTSSFSDKAGNVNEQSISASFQVDSDLWI